jgi:copper chaperone CopZ
MTHEYTIEGMHCQSCVTRVGAALRGVAGVTAADVSLSPPRARVEMSHHVPTDDLAQALKTAGDYRLGELGHGHGHGANHRGATLPVIEAEPSANVSQADAAPRERLYPLFLIVGYIAGAVALIAWVQQPASLAAPMRHFMAGFFLVFSFFKLLDLHGFVDAYRSYDLVARAVPAWGWIYPFVELALGVAYLVNFAPRLTNWVTLALMLVGAVGVLRALLDKRAIRCACLGTALNLPMTKVTLVEDLGMAAMAAAMLAMMP